MKVINFMQTLGHIKASRSCKAWGQRMHQVMSAIAETKPPGLSAGSGYTQRWFARSMLVAVAGGGQLDVRNTTVAQFAEAFPDAKQWLTLFPSDMQIKEAMALCKYAGPPALFTMHLCLVGSKDMNFDLRWLETMKPRIAAKQKSILTDVKIAPTPGYCCLSVLHECDGV